MNWSEIIGQNEVKSMLKSAIAQNRVGHALIFHGNIGSGLLPLALAFSQELLGKKSPDAARKVQHFQHLDLHFSFPILLSSTTSDLSGLYLKEWVSMVEENPYSNYDDWVEKIESKGKQLNFSVKEAAHILDKFSIKSFEGGYKILVIWAADHCNVKVWNTLLKFIEEPPVNTLLIITTESLEQIIDTVKSRCQIFEIPKLRPQEIENHLIENENLDAKKASEIALESDGDWNVAYKLLKQKENPEFEEMFIKWVRVSFQVKKNPAKLKEIYDWSLVAKSWTKDKQLAFLTYCSDVFRLAIMQNYGINDLVYKKLKINDFKWELFADRIHGQNIALILEEINLAALHLSRMGNEAIIWMDLGIKLSRFIHIKA